MAGNNPASQQIADAAATHSVNLLRIEGSLRKDVLAELKRLEGHLIAVPAGCRTFLASKN